MGAVAFVALAAPTVAAAGLGRSLSSSLAPREVSFHSVGGSKLGPSLNPNCGLSVQLGADELAPGRIDALAGPSAFNGTGSFSVTDAHGEQRCFSLVAPLPKLHSTKRLPVVVWFHGYTDDANVISGVIGEANGQEHGCGFRGDNAHRSLGSLALNSTSQFALVCPEALRYNGRPGETKAATAPWDMDVITVWEIPEKMSRQEGTPCTDSDSRDLALVENILAKLDPAYFDVDNVFFAGESAGGAMALYAATCARERGLDSVRSFAVHSSGIKVKGDGLKWEKVPSDKLTSVAECDECDYYPMVPQYSPNLDGLKLCLYDGTNDIMGKTNYTASTENLRRLWPSTGGTVDMHWHERGHVYIEQWTDIVTCLTSAASNATTTHSAQQLGPVRRLATSATASAAASTTPATPAVVPAI